MRVGRGRWGCVLEGRLGTASADHLDSRRFTPDRTDTRLVMDCQHLWLHRESEEASGLAVGIEAIFFQLTFTKPGALPRTPISFPLPLLTARLPLPPSNSLCLA